MSLDLLTRTEKGSALTIAEHDANLDAIAAAVNANETAIAGKADASALTAADASAGAFKSVRAASSSGGITSADRLGAIYATGTSVTLTVTSTGFAAKDWFEVKNCNADTGNANQVITVAISASEDVNASGTNSISVAPGDTVRFTRALTSGEPQWQTEGPIGYLPLAANQVAAVNSAGTTQEARTQKGSITFDIVDPAGDGQYGAWRAAWPGTLDTVKHKTRGGTTCTHTIKKNGTALTGNGYGSAVTMGTSEGSVTCGASFAAGDIITNHLGTVSGLSADGDGRKGAMVTLNITRTGD